ncbi:putative non-specific serine/threonine protein kinase [Helianthus annuus]|nr:putative non-specific serine/threonine protein kinase [Helianthus annuus]
MYDDMSFIMIFNVSVDAVVALMAIKQDIKDPHNVLDSWDFSSVDPCSWRMVTCTSDGSVFALLVVF